jgi:hypothetical protein
MAQYLRPCVLFCLRLLLMDGLATSHIYDWFDSRITKSNGDYFEDGWQLQLATTQSDHPIYIILHRSKNKQANQK